MTNPKYRISPKGKRKLDYPQKRSRSSIKLPLIGKTIYLDVKDNKRLKQLQCDLKRLGATLEDFVSRDINYLITAQPRPKNHEKKCHGDESPAASPFNCEPSPSPLNVDERKVTSVTRGKALAEKARTSRKTNTLLDNAEQWGVKIVSLEGAFKWIDKELKKLPKLSGGHSKVSTSPVCVSSYKSLKSPFVKIEAESYCYRPVHLELEVWPRLNVDTPRGSCPFDGTLIKCGDESHEERGDILAAQVDIPSDDNVNKNNEDNGDSTVNSGKPTTEKSCKKSDSDIFAGSRILTAGELKRRKELKRKQERKRGYCECCHVKYEDLDKHVKEEQHILYVKNKINYEKLDTLICTGPNTQHFLSECMRKTALISASQDFNSSKSKSKQPFSPRKSPRKSTARHAEPATVSPKKNLTKDASKTDTKSLDKKDTTELTRNVYKSPRKEKKDDLKVKENPIDKNKDVSEPVRKNLLKSPQKEKKASKVQEITQVKNSNSPSACETSKTSREKVSNSPVKSCSHIEKVDKSKAGSVVLRSPSKVRDRKSVTQSPKNVESGIKSLRTANKQSPAPDKVNIVKEKDYNKGCVAKDDDKENIDPKKGVEINDINKHSSAEKNSECRKRRDVSKQSAKKLVKSVPDDENIKDRSCDGHNEDLSRKTPSHGRKTMDTSLDENTIEKQPVLSETILTQKCMKTIVEYGQKRVCNEASSDDFEVCFARFSQNETLPESRFNMQKNVNESELETSDSCKKSINVDKKALRNIDSIEVASPAKSDLTKRTRDTENKQQSDKHDIKCKNKRAEKRHSNVNKGVNSENTSKSVMSNIQVENSYVASDSDTKTKDTNIDIDSKPRNKNSTKECEGKVTVSGSEDNTGKSKERKRQPKTFWYYEPMEESNDSDCQDSLKNLPRVRQSKLLAAELINKSELIEKRPVEDSVKENKESKVSYIKPNAVNGNKPKTDKTVKKPKKTHRFWHYVVDTTADESEDEDEIMEEESTDKGREVKSNIENKDVKDKEIENKEEDSKLDSDIFEVPSDLNDDNIVYTKSLADRIKERSNGRRSSVKSYNLNELFSPVRCLTNPASSRSFRSPAGKKPSLPEKKLHKQKSGGCIASAKVINKYRNHRQAHSMSKAENIPNGYHGDDECERTPGTYKSKINSKLNLRKKKHKFWHYVVDTTEDEKEEKKELQNLPKELRLLLDGSDVDTYEDDTKKTRARKSNIQVENSYVASDSDTKTKNANIDIDSKPRNKNSTKECEDKVTVSGSEGNTEKNNERKRRPKTFWYYEPMDESNDSECQDTFKNLPKVRQSKLSAAELINKSETGRKKAKSLDFEESNMESNSQANGNIVNNEAGSETVLNDDTEKPTEPVDIRKSAPVIKKSKSRKKRRFWHYVAETVESDIETSDVDFTLPREVRELKGMPLWWLNSEGNSRKRSRVSDGADEKQDNERDEISGSRLKSEQSERCIKNVNSGSKCKVENGENNSSDLVNEKSEQFQAEVSDTSDEPVKHKSKKRKIFWHYVPCDVETDSDINNEVNKDLPRLRKLVNARVEHKMQSSDKREALTNAKINHDIENTFSDSNKKHSDSNKKHRRKSKHNQDILETNDHVDEEDEIEITESLCEKEKVSEQKRNKSDEKQQGTKKSAADNNDSVRKDKPKKKTFWHYVVVEEEGDTVNESDNNLPKEIHRLKTHLSRINYDSKSENYSDSQAEENGRYAVRKRVNTSYAEIDTDDPDEFLDEIKDNKSTKMRRKCFEKARISSKLQSDYLERDQEVIGEEHSVKRQKYTEKESNKKSKKIRSSKCLNNDLESSIGSCVESTAENKLNRRNESDTVKGSSHRSKEKRISDSKSKPSVENRRETESMGDSSDSLYIHMNGNKSKRRRRTLTNIDQKNDDIDKLLVSNESDCILVDSPSDEGSRSPVFKNVHSSQSTFNGRKGSPVFKKSPKPNSFKTKSLDRVKVDLSNKIDFENKNADFENELSDASNRITEWDKLKEIEKAGSGFSKTPREQRRKEWKRKFEETKQNDSDTLQSPKRRKIVYPSNELTTSYDEGDDTKDDKIMKSPRLRLVVMETENSEEKITSYNESRTCCFSDDEVHCWNKKSTESTENTTTSNSMSRSWSMLSEKADSENLNSDNKKSKRHRISKQKKTEIGHEENDGNSTFVAESESDNGNSDGEENLRQYLPTFFSSPSKLSNSSWIETVDEYLDNSIKTVIDSSFKGNNSSHYFSFNESPTKDKHFGSSPRNKSPFKSALKLKSPCKNHGRTPTKTKSTVSPHGSPYVEKVDDDIEFNFGSPQKHYTKFSDLKSSGSAIRDLSSPVAFNITSTPVHRKSKSGKHCSHQD